MRIALGVALGCVLGLLSTATLAGDKAPSKTDDLSLGREVFVREWQPNDSRSHGGDGLGPVFNDTSCAACHNLGGIGGAGPVNKNVEILSAFFSPQERSSVGVGSIILGIFGNVPATPRKITPQQQSEEASRIHPGFKTAGSVVLHRSSTLPGYPKWRSNMSFGIFSQIEEMPDAPATDASEIAPETRTETTLAEIRNEIQFRSFRNRGMGANQRGNFALSTTERNTTALFGTGLIDSIPDSVLESQARQTFADFPKVSGRVSRMKDGKIGRFGWKAQKATLREFAMTACAVELGLNVPEHEQAGLAFKPDYKAPGLDMDQKECDALVGFLKSLPAPVRQMPPTETEHKALHAGETLFSSVGCAACHTAKLGEVAGIYSDLLLHNMGPDLGDTGSYGVFLPDSPEGSSPEPLPSLTQAIRDEDPTSDQQKKIVGATRLEWRTPPLWGYRDSGPYLHDGRADTLDQAVAFHGGEADQSTRKFFALKAAERRQVETFLKSLVAP